MPGCGCGQRRLLQRGRLQRLRRQHPSGCHRGRGRRGRQDCDGTEVCYADADDDGYTDGLTTVPSTADTDCTDAGEGSAADPSGDCDDSNADIHPAATEVCDEGDTDEDCDGLADDNDDSVDTAGYSVWHADADGDGFGAADSTVEACDQPADTTTDASDCDDNDPNSFPGAEEVEDDGVDQDCDGSDAESSPVADNSDEDEDEDGDEDQDEDTGCGCASLPAAGSIQGGFGLLGLLALVGLRRRETNAVNGTPSA